ncbi:MAG: Na+/H+ antiporter subunit E [Vallitaleaceae bacterium]|nr:Na+/H+ antiporter subunit E [Vallitaleaceae bacterium]
MRLTSRLSFILLLTGIWCILNENIRLSTLIMGVFVSMVTIVILRFLLPSSSYQNYYSISPLTLILFLFVVIKDIYVSAFRTIRHLLRNEINPQFVSTTTKITNPWLQALIANAITLTPGTVTLHMADGTFTVLWLYPLSIRQKEIKKQLIKHFEDILIREDHHA